MRYTYWQHFFINTNFVEYNRHFLSTYFLVDPFILPYWFYSIRWELIDIFSIIVYLPSTFCPTLGHHQGRIYYKNDVTFVCTLLLCMKKNIWAVAVCSVYFLNSSINSVCSQRHLSTLALVWKLILLSLSCIILICSASKIFSFCLLFWYSNIVVFSVRNYL